MGTWISRPAGDRKSIKAVLAHKRIGFTKTHNLGQLLDLLPDPPKSFPPDGEWLPMLTPFGVEHRYGLDDITAWPDGMNTDKVMDCVERTCAWAERQLSIQH
ncbi:MAG: HEPN domain-containing protein [Phycisphaerales bacterium]|nr:HEPN domain-containing protein [Phycisphaerales bacterium]